MTSGFFGEATLTRNVLTRNALLYVAGLLGFAFFFTGLEYALDVLTHFKANASTGEALGSTYGAAYIAGRHIHKSVGSMERKLRSRLAIFYSVIQVTLGLVCGLGFLMVVGGDAVSQSMGGLNLTIIAAIFIASFLLGGGVTYLMSRVALAQVAKYSGRANQRNMGSTA